MPAVIGVDPGISGALALVVDQRLIAAIDVPTWDVDGRKSIDPQRLQEAAEELVMMAAGEEAGKPEIVLERAHAMPQQGVKSSFEYGRTNGLIEAVLWNTGCVVRLVMPTQWKRAAKLLKSDKKASLDRARQLFPERGDLFQRVKDSDRAEAALIALYG